MGYAELIEKLETLPDEKRTEVFDFVDYLAARFASHRAPALDQWTDREFADPRPMSGPSGLSLVLAPATSSDSTMPCFHIR